MKKVNSEIHSKDEDAEEKRKMSSGLRLQYNESDCQLDRCHKTGMHK